VRGAVDLAQCCQPCVDQSEGNLFSIEAAPRNTLPSVHPSKRGKGAIAKREESDCGRRSENLEDKQQEAEVNSIEGAQAVLKRYTNIHTRSIQSLLSGAASPAASGPGTSSAAAGILSINRIAPHRRDLHRGITSRIVTSNHRHLHEDPAVIKQSDSGASE